MTIVSEQFYNEQRGELCFGKEAMSQQRITKSEFKAKALEYFRKVEASGESVIVTDHGQPTIEVRRYRQDERTPLERLRGSVLEYKKPTAPVAEEDWESLT